MSQTITAAPSVEGCIVACARALDLADQFERAGGAYPVIGPHLRHCLDHLVCFLRGLQSGLIEYDARDRDVRIETDADYFRDAARRAMDQLAAMKPSALSSPIKVCQISAPGAEHVTVDSTVERELLFLSGHTIHHLAIITQIAREHGIDLSTDFSVAFSTAAHRWSLNRQSSAH